MNGVRHRIAVESCPRGRASERGLKCRNSDGDVVHKHCPTTVDDVEFTRNVSRRHRRYSYAAPSKVNGIGRISCLQSPSCGQSLLRVISVDLRTDVWGTPFKTLSILRIFAFLEGTAIFTRYGKAIPAA